MARTKDPKRKPQHGTYKEYKHHGCRCRRCRAAVALYVQIYRTNRKKKSLTHGTRSAYNNGCRCVPCTEANAEYAKAWKAQKTKKKAA